MKQQHNWEEQYDKPYILMLMKPGEKEAFKRWIKGTVITQELQSERERIIIQLQKQLDATEIGYGKKVLHTKVYGLPTTRMAAKWTGNDSPTTWLKNVKHHYYK